MNEFTLISIIAFAIFGVNELTSGIGDKGVGLVLILLSIALIVTEQA